jgi:dTMP kinase
MSENNLKDITSSDSSFLFSFEGIEGSGKSTQIQYLKNYLESLCYTILCLREPGGTKFGELLREAILESENSITPIAEAYLFAASRAQLLVEKVLPFLKNDKHIVILDRYIDSSIAYQGFARKLGAQKVIDIHNTYPLDTLPSLTFYLKISLETSMQRQQTRGQEKDYFEKENNLFYKTLINGYEYCSQKFSKRICVIDATQSIDSVSQQIKKKIKAFL